jgi:hypothetical protein
VTPTVVTLNIPGTPPSYNTQAHAHWTKVRKAKQDWQSYCEIALMEMRVPRELKRVAATAQLLFTLQRRRDEGNFRVVLEKALGDALVNGGWLPDDTPEHYQFGAIELLVPDLTPDIPRTLVRLAW